MTTKRNSSGPRTQTCLVIMPFSDANGTNSEYWGCLFNALSKKVKRILPDYECSRMNIGAGPILGNLMRAIVAADLVVCDLSDLKPNVLFELGSSMVLEKPILLLQQGDISMPADISNYAFTKYQFNEERGKIQFPQDGRRDLFEASIRHLVSQPPSSSLLSTDSNLGRILKAFANTLKHAIKLERENAILAPALRSLFDSLISEHAEKLSKFIEANHKSVTIQIESPKILFDLLIALLNGLSPQDRYDSITWRKHWTSGNIIESRNFLKAIVQRGEDSPRMRRIFLVGILGRNSDGSWDPNRSDVQALNDYLSVVRAQPRVDNRVLFLPDPIVEQVAQVSHMGRITKCDGGETSVLLVFSEYTKGGSLRSFRLSRSHNTRLDYEHFWELAVPMSRMTVKNKQPVKVPRGLVHFSGALNRLKYHEQLRRLLDKLGI